MLLSDVFQHAFRALRIESCEGGTYSCENSQEKSYDDQPLRIQVQINTPKHNWVSNNIS